MKIHEYQAKDLLRKYGVKTPRGVVAARLEEVGPGYDALGGPVVAVKSQIHAGGRGKGVLYSGEDPSQSSPVQEGGVKVAGSKEEALSYAGKILGNYLVTKQTGGKGKKVQRVYLEEGAQIDQEFYLSILTDRTICKPVILVSRAGGMDIEEIAAKEPEKLIRVAVDPNMGLQGWQARRLLYALQVPQEGMKQGADFLRRLWRCYDEEDCSLLEINPLALDKTGELLALDCKIDLDDNALYRHKENMELRDTSEEDPLELKASEYNLNYIKLDGNVGCMVNGAGLAMATMDIVKLAGAEPANFLDVGGGANAESVANGFRIILGDPNVKAIFVNIFGGIVQCDRVANGIVQAAREVHVNVPLIVRLKGTNAEKAREILAGSGLALTVADELDDGSLKVAQAVGVA